MLGVAQSVYDVTTRGLDGCGFGHRQESFSATQLYGLSLSTPSAKVVDASLRRDGATVGEGGRVAYFLLQVAYTAEGWAALGEQPHNRLEEVRPVVAQLGGSVDNQWMSFGDTTCVLLQLPDNVSAAAFSIAVSAGGAVRAAKTTPPMTVEEGMEVMRKASDVGYTPPAEWGKHAPPPIGAL